MSVSPSPSPFRRPVLSRRAFLGVGVGALATAALAACSNTAGSMSGNSSMSMGAGSATSGSASGSAAGWVNPSGAEVLRVEQARAGTGRVTDVSLVAGAATLDLAGTTAKTMAYGPVPAQVIRLGAGDTLRAAVRNDMAVDTSVHFHGVAMRNDMDGVPPVTQAAIAAGQSFTYDFVVPHAGTYWFHPHVGVQLDQGLYGALVVEDPSEPLAYDDDWVVVLDDWLDGVTATPDDVLTELKGGMGDMSGMGDMYMRMGNMLMGADSDLLGGDAGDVFYPYFLINGKPVADPTVFTGKPGSKVRIRFVNAGADTAFQVALGGHTMTVVHSDGFPVNPVEVDSVLIGMGERYDVIVTLGDGAFPLVAEALGKRDKAFAVVRTADGAATPSADAAVAELSTSRVGTASMLTAPDSVTLAAREPDRALTFNLTGGMAGYDWGINGRQFNMTDPLSDAYAVREGERVRLTIYNDSDMWHPFHIHGHTYQHTGGGPRKDTSIVLPKQTLTVDFDADNPGLWMAHCHNIYHAESGMMTTIGYQV